MKSQLVNTELKNVLNNSTLVGRSEAHLDFPLVHGCQKI